MHNLLAYSSDFEDLMETALKNNGGGVMNHYMYFDGMTPNKTEPSQNLRTAIIKILVLCKMCPSDEKTGNITIWFRYAWFMYDKAPQS